MRTPIHRIIPFALMLFLLTACAVRGVDVEQEQATGLAGELLDGHTLGQTLTLHYDGLYRLDLYTATYARDNSHPVIFRIQEAPDTGEGLVRITIPADQISNSGPTVITFPPLDDTAGRTLYFSIESPGSVPGDAITVYRSEADMFAAGQMFVDGRPTAGDLAFIAYTQETFTAAGVWNDFYSRARQDRPFFLLYCGLLAVLLLLLVVTFVGSWRRPGEDGGGSAGDARG